MNEILKPIEAPSLNTSDYGKNIKEQFENIDDNFKLIANRDFVKGDPGNSLYIENISLDKSGNGIGGKLYSALEQAITKHFNSEGALNQVNSYNWDDSITSGELNVPIIVSQNETKGEPEYICAASPVMIFDNRFNDKAINGENFSDYEGIDDVTSILNFKKDDNDNWLCELNLSYPRLQYSNGSFRWVINNTNTVVKSTGIKGDPGESTNIWIVRTQEFSEEFDGTTINIADYFMDGRWTHSTPEGIKTGDLAIVYCESKDKDYYGFFISQIKVENNNNMIVYDHNGNIQNINYVKNTTEFFKSLGDSNAAKGMFLKFQPGDSSTQSHMLYNEGENLYIKPVDNYDNIAETYDGNPSSINIVGYNKTKINSPTIELDGNTDINNGLTVTGNTYLTDNLTMGGTFTVKPWDPRTTGLVINEDGSASINWRNELIIKSGEGINLYNPSNINTLNIDRNGIQKITLPKSCGVDLKIDPGSWDRRSITPGVNGGKPVEVPLYQKLNPNEYYKINIKNIYQAPVESSGISTTLFDGGVFRALLTSDPMQEATYNLVIDGFPKSSLTYFGVSTILDSVMYHADKYKFNIYFGKSDENIPGYAGLSKIYEFYTEYDMYYNKRVLFSILTDSEGYIIACNHYDKPYIYEDMTDFVELGTIK